MPKTVTLRLDDATYAFFRDCAQADNRTLSNMIETAAKRQLEGVYLDAKARRGRMIG